MSRTRSASRLYYGICCLVLFFVAAAASFNDSLNRWHFDSFAPGSLHSAGSFAADLDGTDQRPFVYRQLLPMLANWIDARFSEQAKDRLFNLKGRGGSLIRNRIIDSPLARDRTYFLRWWITYAVIFLFAWISVYAMYLLGKSLGFPPAASALAAIAMILLMPYFEDQAAHLYDFPEMAFLMLAVWMALRFDWWWLVPLAVLATWNKESFLLFVPTLYPLVRLKNSRTIALVGTAVIGLTSAAIYFLLRARFQHNPGGTVEFHLMDQIRSLPTLYDPRRRTFLKVYGLWLPGTANVFVAALIASTTWRVWHKLQRPIRRHIQIAAIINFPLFVLFCAPNELRDLSFLYPALVVLIAANLSQWIGEQTKLAFPQSV
ncbi:MAG: hypothetical protein ABSD67_05970 [Terracidiphilus sp.]|jgi:hypothetical protein